MQTDQLVTAWSIFEKSREVSGMRENCQSQLAMSAMKMCDLFHILRSWFPVALKEKGPSMEDRISTFKVWVKKGEEHQLEN